MRLDSPRFGVRWLSAAATRHGKGGKLTMQPEFQARCSTTVGKRCQCAEIDKTSETQTLPEAGKRGPCHEAKAELNAYCASDSSIPPIPRTASVNFTMSNGSGKS